MAFEKLTGLVNLEELEKESDLQNVNGAGTGKPFCVPVKTKACGNSGYDPHTRYCGCQPQLPPQR